MYGMNRPAEKKAHAVKSLDEALYALNRAIGAIEDEPGNTEECTKDLSKARDIVWHWVCESAKTPEHLR